MSNVRLPLPGGRPDLRYEPFTHPQAPTRGGSGVGDAGLFGLAVCSLRQAFFPGEPWKCQSRIPPGQARLRPAAQWIREGNGDGNPPFLSFGDRSHLPEGFPASDVASFFLARSYAFLAAATFFKFAADQSETRFSNGFRLRPVFESRYSTFGGTTG